MAKAKLKGDKPADLPVQQSARIELESLIERFLNQVSQVFMPRVFECRTTS